MKKIVLVFFVLSIFTIVNGQNQITGKVTVINIEPPGRCDRFFAYSTDVGSFVPIQVYVHEVTHVEEHIHSDIVPVLCVYLNEDFACASAYTPYTVLV